MRAAPLLAHHIESKGIPPDFGAYSACVGSAVLSAIYPHHSEPMCTVPTVKEINFRSEISCIKFRYRSFKNLRSQDRDKHPACKLHRASPVGHGCVTRG